MSKKEKTSARPTTRKCGCAHAYQDERYGKGVRLHNLSTGKDGTFSAGRCTVCGAERTLAG